MKRVLAGFLVFFILLLQAGAGAAAQTPVVRLGNEVLFDSYHYLIKGKRVGLVTNQTGVDSKGKSLIDILAADKSLTLAALYGPEHGIDGAAKAGAYVESYTHPRLGIPVYSLYGKTRRPTAEMLKGVDVLLFDIQDIGARSYTYMSTLNYVMAEAKKYNIPVIVLDRPNPVGGVIVEGPMMEDRFISFVGVDNLPMAHGMTAGELARFFNRKIGADLRVIPMTGYTRQMVFQDTGLPWVRTSPNIQDLDSAFGYMATGLGEGTGIFQADKFRWIGGRGINEVEFARLLNGAGLPGVVFLPEKSGTAGGVRLKITDYRTFNPARTGIYALAFARSLNNFTVPKSGQTSQSIVMFDKIMGTDKIGQYLEQGLSPQQIEANYAPALNRFKEERTAYLIYGDAPYRLDLAGAATERLYGLGVIEGYPDGTFRLANNITRAEFAKVAVIMAGLKNREPLQRSRPSLFRDVLPGSWHAGWVNLAFQQGFVKGYPDGSFRPDENISAAEVITVLLRILGYNDHLTGAWPGNYLDKAAELALTWQMEFSSAAALERGKVFQLTDRILDFDRVSYDAAGKIFRKTGEASLFNQLLESQKLTK